MTNPMPPIYFDNNATTALDPQVLEAMLQDLKAPPLNPSSQHFFGKCAKKLLLEAKNTTAAYFSFLPEEVIFTSCGTESVNTFIRSLHLSGHVISTEIEHSCVYKSLLSMQKQGLEITFLPVDHFGAPNMKQIQEAIKPNTQAIILSAANSETGVKLDLKNVADIAYAHKIPLFIDAVGFVGKEKWENFPGITAVAISGHKFHAPKGIGALLVRKEFKLSPLLLGGNQEGQKRAGTENLAGILGLAKALLLIKENEKTIFSHLKNLRDTFEESLKKQIPDLSINGTGPRISNTSNIAFNGIDGETLLIQLDRLGIYASHGSACASGAMEPSRVLTKMGLPKKTTTSSIRFSFSRMNTLEEIEKAVTIISQIVNKLKTL